MPVDGCGFLEVIDKRYADMVTGRDTYHRTWYGAVDRPGEYPLAFDRLPHDLHSSESKMLGPIRVYDVPAWLVSNATQDYGTPPARYVINPHWAQHFTLTPLRV